MRPAAGRTARTGSRIRSYPTASTTIRKASGRRSARNAGSSGSNMEQKLMYCPACNVQILIKANTNIVEGKCPLCQEAPLLPAVNAIVLPLRNIRELLKAIVYSNNTVTIKKVYADNLVPYVNLDNFDLECRKN